jgi:hypothetical protein
VTTSKLAVLATFRVVEFTNGIVRVSKLNTVVVAFEVKPADTILVVVTVLVTVRFVKGCIIFAEFTFEIVLPYMSEEFTTPKARLEAFRLERVLPVRPTTFAI